MEVSDIRRRLRGAIEKARQTAVERRSRNDAAAREFDEFLGQRAVPVFQQFAAALKAEGHFFRVFTPVASVRLASERSPEEFIELVFDDTSDPPAVIGRSSRGRGRRTITSERPLQAGASIATLTDDDVLTFLVDEIAALIER